MLSRRQFVAAGLAAGRLSGMQAGCQTNAWPIGDYTAFLDVLQRIRKLDYRGFETSFRNLQSRFSEAPATRAAIEKTGLRFLGIHIFLTSYDQRTALAPWDQITAVADGGAALGAEMLILSGRSVGSGAQAVGRKADTLSRAGEYCRKRGLGLAYHNHDLEFAHNGAEMEEMLRRTSPELVSLVFDAGHAYVGGVNAAAFVKRHSRRMRGIHLRDFRNGKQVPLGQGDFDLRGLAEALREVRWSGWLINEEERPNDVRPGDAVVQPARRHLRSIFGV